MGLVEWQDFEKIEIRVGTVVSAKMNTSARKSAYILEVDFGQEIGVKKTSAQITDLYDCEQLIGKQVIAVVNFPPKQIGKMISEVLVTGFPNQEGKVVLCSPDFKVPNGSRLY
ncbi:tRNA-binding protein [Roseivirga sp.]|uniref:tRNA-binding protein n=1 Tax=Roseivirga sp. TaxID=1964215 RepID=UPI003B5261AF